MHSSNPLPATGKLSTGAYATEHSPKLREQVRQALRTLHFCFLSAMITPRKMIPYDEIELQEQVRKIELQQQT